MFSQFEEEKYILDFFGERKGGFLDIGAWDGIEASNTRALALRGWRGLLVEPCPSVFDDLLHNTHDIPGMICLNAAVSDYRQLRKFHLQSEWGGTLNDDILKKNLRGHIGDYYVLTVSPRDLWDIAQMENMRFEFVSLDAEWMDYEILTRLVGLLSFTDLLCVEIADGRFATSDPIPAMCSKFGFSRVIGKTIGNLLVAREA